MRGHALDHVAQVDERVDPDVLTGLHEREQYRGAVGGPPRSPTLWAVAALAVFVGNKAGRFLDPDRTKKVAAVLFAVLGVLLVGGAI